MSTTVENLSMIKARTDKETALAFGQIYLKLQPDFQREYESWDGKMQTRFIESILINRAMNPIWVVLNKEERCEEVLDGMHRLTTAINFMNNKYCLATCAPPGYANKYFKDLSDDDQAKIRNYNFSINKLDSSYREDPTKLFEMYEILNRCSKPLNWHELMKPLLKPLYAILEPHKNDFLGSPVFSKDASIRGAIETEMLKLIALSEIYLSFSFDSINSLYRNWIDKEIGKTADVIKINIEAKRSGYNQRLVRMKKYMKYFEEMQLFEEGDKSLITTGNHVPIMIILARCACLITDEALFRRRAENLVKTFKANILNTNINESLHIQGRNSVFQKRLIQEIDKMMEEEIGVVAETRLFSTEQIQWKLKEQNNNCVLCTKPIKGKQKFEGDHIIPWANGGKTIAENLQVVHAVCHRKKK